MFYGWWVVGASFLIALYVAGVVVYGFTAIFEPIADELGWSYTQISFAASLRGIEMGLLAPLIGILVDRWGPRRLIFSGAVISALGLILLSRVTSLGTFYAAFFLVAIGMSACTMTVLLTAVANWFRSKVGLASGITISGFGFGGLLIPVVVTLIDMYEWRMTMTILALGMLAIVLPLSLLVRHKPEQYGYLPDGEVKGTVIADDGLAPLQAAEVSVRAKQALKTSSFWHIALAFTCQMMMISAVITHIMPYLSSIGVARSTSSLVATTTPLMSIGGRLGLGWLGDKFDRRRVAAGAFAMMGFGAFCFGYASTLGPWLLVPFLILFGIGYGGNQALRPSLTRQFFGRANFGTILGLIIGINMLGSIIGPPLAGWVFDNWGSYQGIWFVFAGLSAAALISVLTTPPISTTVQLVDRA
ncbi:MFS transporter [Chloroflexota bacterium]